MAFCPNCGATIPDGSVFCASCGTSLVAASNQQAPAPAQAPVPPPQQYQQPYQQAAPDQFDHTAEFDPTDISDNKVIAMLIYLAGVVGLFISFIAGTTNSPYASFHARQYLKILVCDLLIVTCSVLLFWTFIVPIAGAIASIILRVLLIIGFFQVCGGKAKEPAIIRNFGFLR